MSRQYLVHYDSAKSEVQLRACDSGAMGFCHILEVVAINPEDVPKQSDKWHCWNQKWREYFANKHHIDATKIQ